MMKRVFGRFKILVVFVGVFFLVGCGGGGSSSGVENKKPIANAGKDKAINIGKSISFDASLSHDSDGKIVSYIWRDGDTILSKDISFSKSDFSEGDYTIKLVVTDDKGATSSDTVNIAVLGTPVITQALVQKTLESNTTILNKRVLVDDETIVTVSMDIVENNITVDIPIKVKKEHYKKDGLYADFVVVDFGDKTFDNLELSLKTTHATVKTKTSKSVRARGENFQSYCKDIVNRHKKTYSSTYQQASIVESSNICEYISDIEVNSKNHTVALKLAKTLPNDLTLLKYGIRQGAIARYDSIKTTPTQIVTLNRKDTVYYIALGINETEFESKNLKKEFLSFYITNDYLQDNGSIIAKKTLAETRASESLDGKAFAFNNFVDTQERKQPIPVNQMMTHRIVDFDKVLDPTKTTPNEIWNKTDYAFHDKRSYQGRTPLLLIHGWQGDKGLRDPNKLGLWENSELNYWHNFLAYYLTSEELQRKYHVYLYHYTSYKHVTYNAKQLQNLLDDVKSSSPNSDLAKGLSSDDKGIAILAHSMGGLVARSFIEEYNGLGNNAQKLKRLITLDTPHHGSVGSIDSKITNFPKDLATHGAIDLNYDNFDNGLSSGSLKEMYYDRRHNTSLDGIMFDTEYCDVDLDLCKQATGNPYLIHLNKNFSKYSSLYSSKYIFYTAWSVHDRKNIAALLQSATGEGLNSELKNYSETLNFIENNAFDISTIFIGHMRYSAGGAESVGSSLLAKDKKDSVFNPSYNTILSVYDDTLTLESQTSFDDEHIVIPKLMYLGKNTNNKDTYLSFILKSDGQDHPYKIPYRLFWDYDHGNIYNGSSGDNNWDLYIEKNKILSKEPTDTQFNSHRTDYINAALQLRFPDKNRGDSASNMLNPLKYEPSFLVIEKDLLDAVSNGDLDGDGMLDKWEYDNDLNMNNSADATEDDDQDGLTNLQEFTYKTDPQMIDSDNDSYSDFDEVEKGSDPLDINSIPQGNTPPYIITFKYNQSLPNQEGNFTIQARDNTAISSITIEYGDGASDNESYLAGGFGGGSDTTDKEINATFAHTYIAGNYTTKLTVCDEDDMCSDKSMAIQVSDSVAPLSKLSNKTIITNTTIDNKYKGKVMLTLLENQVTGNKSCMLSQIHLETIRAYEDDMKENPNDLVHVYPSMREREPCTWESSNDLLTLSFNSIDYNVELNTGILSIGDIFFDEKITEIYDYQEISLDSVSGKYIQMYAQESNNTLATIKFFKNNRFEITEGSDNYTGSWVKSHEAHNYLDLTFDKNSTKVIFTPISSNSIQRGEFVRFDSAHYIVMNFDDISNIDTTISKVLKTGQTKCYNDDTYEYEEAFCTEEHKGQDGYYQIGLDRSYTRDDTNEIVTDNITGLQWQDNEIVSQPWISGQSNSNNENYPQKYCKNLSLDGENWRLPTIYELKTLLSYNISPTINHLFKYVDSRKHSYYWSNTNIKNTNNYIWSISFYDGQVSGEANLNTPHNVKCVRGIKLINRKKYIKNQRTVLDTSTGLIWQNDYTDNNGSIKIAKWNKAISYCNNLILAGFDDWRLPNVNELNSIIVDTRFNTNISGIFENIGEQNTFGYFTSTTSVVFGNNVAIHVDISNGANNYTYKGLHLYKQKVRCVRTGL